MKQSKTQVAKDLGVSRTRLYSMVREGIVVPATDGTINITTARAAMKEKLSPVHGGKRTPAVVDESFSEARTRKEKALADTREMEAAVMRGELVDAAEVRAGLAKAYTCVKMGLRAIPSKISGEVFHLALNSKSEKAGVTEIFKKLLTEIDEVLLALSKTKAL